MLTLPYNALAWTEIVPAVGQTFVQYNVYRDDVRIATITDVDAVTYDDYAATPNVEHTYGVSWTSNTAGDLLESTPTEVAETLEFTSAYLHAVGDETSYAELRMSDYSVSFKQDAALLRARGRRLPSMLIGEGRFRTVQVSLVVEKYADRDVWDAVDALQEALYTDGAILCLRAGHMRDRLFGKIDGESLQRTDTPMFYRVSFTLTEVYYDEEI